MMGRSHFLLAAAAYGALAVRPLETPLGTLAAPVLAGGAIPEGPAALALSGAVAALAGLAPDLDTHTSTISRGPGPAGVGLAWALERTVGHRGPLHSLLGAWLAWLLGNGVGGLVGLVGLGGPIALGWQVHLLADGCTSRGVPWLRPLPLAVRPPFRFATDTWTERAAVALGLAGWFWWAGGVEGG